MKTITLTETHQPCYDVYARFAGIRKRCRKVEAHSIKLIEGLSLEDALNDAKEIKGTTLAHFIDQAKSTILAGYKVQDDIAVTLQFRHVTRSQEFTDGVAFICTGITFRAANHTHLFTMGGNV